MIQNRYNSKIGKIIDHNPEGKWSLASVQKKYLELRNLLGSEEKFELILKTYTNSGGITWIYNIMDTVVDGVKSNDKACIELSIEYIEDNVMGTYTGYIRESMARNLKNATLTDRQKNRLIKVFLGQLKQGNLLKEYKQYIKLFKKIGVEPYRQEIEKCRSSSKKYICRAAERLLS